MIIIIAHLYDALCIASEAPWFLVHRFPEKMCLQLTLDSSSVGLGY